MPSTSLKMHRNRFRPGLRPGPHWGSLQRSLRPLAGGEGARRILPKNPTPSSALRAPTPPKINPSYGLGRTLPAQKCICSGIHIRLLVQQLKRSGSQLCNYSAPIGERSTVTSVSVCLCVCLSAIILSELHIRSSPNLLCMLPMAVARSSSDGVVICYAFLV